MINTAAKILFVFFCGLLVMGCASKTSSLKIGPYQYDRSDKHAAIAYFQSKEGEACYYAVKDAIDYAIKEENKQPEPPSGTGHYDALIVSIQSTQAIVSEAFKSMTSMMAYSHGIDPESTAIKLAKLCQKPGFYDLAIAKSKNRHETGRHVADGLLGIFPIGASLATAAFAIDRLKGVIVAGGDVNTGDGTSRTDAPTFAPTTTTTTTTSTGSESSGESESSESESTESEAETTEETE